MIEELSTLISDYLKQRPQLSLNSLAINMGVPETSLRRIKNCELVRPPKNDNLLKILSFIFKTDDLMVIAENLQGDLKNYIKEEFFLPEKGSVAFDVDRFIPDQQSYLIYKLAANSSGVEKSEVQRLFGDFGLMSAEKMIRSGVLEERENFFFNVHEHFRMSDERFIENFKAVSDFIKVRGNEEHAHLYFNFSESLSPEAIRKIHTIQKKANRDILKVIDSESSQGEIPFFFIGAIDSIK